MSVLRDDRTVQDATGRAIANASVYWLNNQSNATTTTINLTQLVTIYTDSTGITTLTNPQVTDGFGYASAYMAAQTLTVAIVWNGVVQAVYPDQVVGTATATQPANSVYAGPASGSAQIPTFRSLVPLDVVSGVNNQTGTTYTIAASDNFKLITINNSSPVAVSLSQAGSVGFANGFGFFLENRGSGTVTLTPSVSTIDGASSLQLSQNQGVWVSTDGTNYFTMRGIGGSGGGSGTVTSVAMTVPAEFSIAGSPISVSGTLALTKANESANTVWAGPTSGGAAAPTFRGIVNADLPSPMTTATQSAFDNSTNTATTAYADNNIKGVNVVWFREEFLGGFSYSSGGATSAAEDTGWTMYPILNNPTSLIDIDGTYGHMGILQFVTSATASGSGINLTKGNGGGKGSFGALGSNAGWEANFIVALGSTSTIAMRVGFFLSGQNTADAPTNGIWVRYDTASADTKFTFECRSASTSTTSVTNSITADTGYHHFRIRSTVAGTILFSVDGGTETSISTNVPTGAMAYAIEVLTRTTATATLNADFCDFFANTGRT